MNASTHCRVLAFVVIAGLSVADAVVTAAQRREFVDQHNSVRRSVSPPAKYMASLEWDSDLEALAQKWVDGCSWGHNPSRIYPPSPSAWVGENCALGSGTLSPTAAVKMWADEVSSYNYDRNSCSGVCGHYTQVVWANTTKVGCGIAVCSGLGTFIACDYFPGGNYAGRQPYAKKSGSSGAVAAAVIIVLLLVAIAACIVGALLYRRHKGLPLLPSKDEVKGIGKKLMCCKKSTTPKK